MKFIKDAERQNELLDDGSGSWVSYNPALKHATGISTFDPDTEDGETALHQDGTYLILNGDFRREYEEVYPDASKCQAVYDKHKARCRSSWSDDKEHE